MREILFRGKPIDEETIIGNDFYYGDLCHYANGEVTIRQPETGYEIAVLPETVGQFTGITDVNGVKVFEGDKTSGGVVIYDEYYCSFLIDFPIKNKKMYFEDIMRIFVNGNIHDNPELLNNKQNVK